MRRIPLLDLDTRYARYLQPYAPHLALVMLAMMASAVLEIIAPWPLKYIVDSVLGGHPLNDPVGRAVAGWFGDGRRVLTVVFALSVIGITALSGLLAYSYDYLKGAVQARITFRLRSDVFRHLQALSPQFHDNSRTGEIINRVNLDVGRVMEALVAGSSEFAFNLLKLAGIAGVMWTWPPGPRGAKRA